MKIFEKLNRLFKPAKRNKLVWRGYDAAKIDRLLEGWTGDLGISAYDISGQLPLVRSRVREQAKNNPYVVRALQMFRNNIIGPKGVALSMDIPDGKGGIDMELSDEVEQAWKLWSETPEYCDAEGKKTLTQILWAAVDSWKREGEAFICFVPDGAHYGNPFKFSIKLRRADACAVKMNVENRNGNQILNGVEIDGWGKPVAYHFYTTMTKGGVFAGDTVRVPAAQVCHLFEEEYEGQTRGFPCFAPVLRGLKMSDGYSEAELVAARVDACRNGTWQAIDSGDPAMIADENDEGLHQQLEPGEDRIAPIGWKYEANAPSRPNAGYGQFMKDILRRVASGLSLSYNAWASDLEGVSYSSIRAGTLEDRETYKCQQELVVDKVLRPLFRRRGGWLDCWYLSRKGKAIPPAMLKAIRTADTWLPRRWEWVDPQSEAAAKVIAVQQGWTTNSDVTAESGKDYYNNIQTQKQEIEWRQNAGVEITQGNEDERHAE